MDENKTILDVDMSKIREEAKKTGESINDLGDDFKDFGKDVSKSLDDVVDSMKDMASTEDKIQSMVDGFSGLTDAAAGVAGGFQVVQGAMNLMGVESEEVEEAILKMQSVMAITDGFQAISNGVKGFYEMTKVVKQSTLAVKTLGAAQKVDAAITATLTTVMKGFTASTVAAKVAVKSLKVALVSTGIGALVVGLGEGVAYLADNWDKLKSKLGGGSKQESKASSPFYGRDPEADLYDLETALAKGEITMKEYHENIIKIYKKAGREVSEEMNNMYDEVILHNKKFTEEEQSKYDLLNDLRVQYIDKVRDSELWIMENERDLQDERTKNYEDDLKKRKQAQDDLNNFIKSSKKDELDLTIYTLQKEKDEKLKVLEESYEASIISEEQYNEQRAQIIKIYSDKIKEIVKQHNNDILSEEDEFINNNLSQQLEKFTNEYDLLLTNNRLDYERSIADAESRGEQLEAYERRITMLNEEKTLLEELKAGYEALGDTESAKTVDLDIKSNRNELDATQQEEADWEVSKIAESFGVTEEAMAELSSLSMGLGGDFNNMFSQITSGVESVSRSLKKGEKGWKAYGNVAKLAFGATGALMQGLASQQDESTKAGFDKKKKFEIAAATMSMFDGIVSAWTGAMDLGPILGPIIGGINSAMIATMGALNISKIKQTQFEGGGSTDTSNPPMPSLTALQSMAPGVASTTNVEGASTEGLIKDQRVYVLESDIRDVSRKVNVTESEASF